MHTTSPAGIASPAYKHNYCVRMLSGLCIRVRVLFSMKTHHHILLALCSLVLGGLVRCQEVTPTNSTTNQTTVGPDSAMNYTTDFPVNWTTAFANDTPCEYSVAIKCNPPNCDSPTLDEVARHASIAKKNCSFFSVAVNLEIDVLQLSKDAIFENVSSLSLHGNNSTIVCETSDLGIVLRHAGNVELAGLIIRGCGYMENVAKALCIKSAVHILLCDNININNITIMNSNGSGLNFQRNHENVTITGSAFINNTLIAPNSNYSVRLVGGSGVYVHVSGNPGKQVYRFIDSVFIGNKAKSDRYDFLMKQTTVGRGRGAGMRVTIEGSNNSLVLILNCKFERNEAFLGAGLSAQIQGNGFNNEVVIENTMFMNNGCEESGGFGGGGYFSFERLRARHVNDYTICLQNVTFDSNCAELGGGTYFFSARSVSHNKIIFDNCTWKNNYAHTGSAVLLSVDNFKKLVDTGFLPIPAFIGCNFTYNTVQPTTHGNRQSLGSGTLYSTLMSVRFESFAVFENNIGSGIVIVNGIVDFTKANAIFVGNQGVQGGAILLIGTSALQIGHDRLYKFTGNIVTDKGGAINAYLVDETDFVSSRSCFIHYRDQKGSDNIYSSKNWSASLIFEGNKARVGHSIYATSIIPCQVVSAFSGDWKFRILNSSEVFESPGVIINESNMSNQIATEGKSFDYSGTLVQTIPGEQQKLGIRILDDFDEEVPSFLTAYVQNETGNIASEFIHVTNDTVQLSGKEGGRGKLVLQSVGPRKMSLTVDIEFLSCPPGFKLTELSTCTCDMNSYVGIPYCIGYNAYLIPGFWTGYVQNGTLLATARCPVGFCHYKPQQNSREIMLPKSPSELEQAICGETRRGTLCGWCRQNYTTYYHSPNHKCFKPGPYSCKIGWIYYILSEILPVTILFLLMLLLNINFTTGTLNGFILFSQLLDTLQIDPNRFPAAVIKLSQGYKIIYGLFNFNPFAIDSLSFCLWNDATALGMLTFKYTTVLYSFVLVLSVILFMRYSAARCCGSHYSISALRNSVIHGLSGFLILCYGQCIRVSFNILYRNREFGHKEMTKGLNTRVLLNGNIEYFSPEHLRFAIPALLSLIVIGILPPVFLIVYPLINRLFVCIKLENTRLATYCLYPANKLKPLLDSFQGSFKDNFRFFAGVYFLYRWIAVAAYALIPTTSLFYAAVQALLILMLVVHSSTHPYKRRWHNILDSLLLADLSLINGITLLNYHLYRVDLDRGINDMAAALGSIQIVLIYLPLVYVVVYMFIWLAAKIYHSCAQQTHNGIVYELALKKINSFSEDNLPYRLVGAEHDARETSNR